MPEKLEVASVADVPPGEARVVEAGGKPIALVNAEGTFYALDNTCLHRGGPLGEGDLEGLVLTCPWHGWRWDVRSGANVNNPAVKLSCFPVTVEGGMIYVEL
jgi:nitrite reductase (NADH) small subunit